MPASPRPRRLHHLGSNARIYIAQECTTRGPRRLHFHVQEHISRDARPKDARIDPLWRASKKMPHRHLIHAWKDTRVHPLDVHTEMDAPRHTRVQEDTRVGFLLRAPKMAAPTWTR